MRRGFSGSVRVFYPKFTQEEVFERIKEVASSLEGDLGLLKVTLFGSYATGRYTVASDIDILIESTMRRGATGRGFTGSC
jgi:predicted nucleotidyltransferase